MVVLAEMNWQIISALFIFEINIYVDDETPKHGIKSDYDGISLWTLLVGVKQLVYDLFNWVAPVLSRLFGVMIMGTWMRI